MNVGEKVVFEHANWSWCDGQVVRVRIENIVYTCNVGMSLNMNDVHETLLHFGPQYNRKKFAAVIIRFRESSQETRTVNPPKIALLIFGGGKMVCTGAKVISQALYNIQAVISCLNDHGYNLKFQGLTTENVVASVRTPWNFDLAALYQAHTEFCEYDPELFPGLTFHHPAYKPVTVLLFDTGKCVVTGARIIENIEKALEITMPIVKPFIVKGRGKAAITLAEERAALAAAAAAAAVGTETCASSSSAVRDSAHVTNPAESEKGILDLDFSDVGEDISQLMSIVESDDLPPLKRQRGQTKRRPHYPRKKRRMT